MNVRLALRSVRAAFAFLTRLPVGGRQPFNAEELRWCSAHFPLVGLCIGAMLAVVHHASLSVLGVWGAAVMTVSASLILTGAFHEDGLADTFDAVGGGYTRDQILEILKDSRIGTYGVAALTLVLVARVACLAVLGAAAAPALIVIESVSRAPPVAILSLVPYATRPPVAKSKELAKSSDAQAILAVAWATVVLLGAWVTGVVRFGGAVGIAVLSGGVAALAAWRLSRTVQGVTGDFLGAIQQLVAVSLWLVWAAP